MEVIGAGYGRTGTLSMRSALSELLGEPCYHMASIVENPEQLELWSTWAKNPEKQPDWDRIFDGYGAAVDAPICFFVEELMAHYPDAKVVLTVRDPERWVASFQSLMRANMQGALLGLVSSRVRRFGKFARVMGQKYIGKIDRESLLSAYEQHNAHIRRIVPPEKLLEMRASDGWEPLCRFLDKPVPEHPFPHKNEGTKTIRRGHWKMAFSSGSFTVMD